MRKLLAALTAVSALALAPSANAATFTPGSPQFQVFGDIFSGPITARFGNTVTTMGAFQDIFQFTIPQNGLGSGSLTTEVNTDGLFTAVDLDITSVLVNGLAAGENATANQQVEQFSITNVPIVSGQLNQIVVNGFSRGLGSYSGTATFTPRVVQAPIPEPATWAMMLVGFGAVGFGMRRRRDTKSNVRVRFA